MEDGSRVAEGHIGNQFWYSGKSTDNMSTLKYQKNTLTGLWKIKATAKHRVLYMTGKKAN